MAQRLQKRETGETFSDEAKQPTDSIKRLRFIVLGSDGTLINEACETILRSADVKIMDTNKRGTCALKEACVSGRHVSVVQTPAYWLENLKTSLSISKRVRSMKSEMEFCYSMVFPGPHAFLLVLGGPQNSGKEHYLLRALCDVFGQEALDYSMVLFMHGFSESEIAGNRCVRKCRKRFHILKDNEDNVLQLFHDATGAAMKQGTVNFFTKDLELLLKAETYFKKEFDAKYEERESILRRDLAETKTTEENLRTEMEKQNSKNLRELQDLREELEAHRARENQLKKALDASVSAENQLRKELDSSISRENQLSRQIDALKKKKYELKEELFTFRYHKRINAELIASNERESQLKSDNEKLRGELEQLKGNEKRIETNPRESKDMEEFLLTENNCEVQEERDRARTWDRREVEPDESAVPPPSVSEDKDKPKPQKDTVSLEFEGLKLVRQNSKKLDSPGVSESKVKSLSGRECEMESKAIDALSNRSLKVERLKPVRHNSMNPPPKMSEDKPKPQKDTGYLEFEGL